VYVGNLLWNAVSESDWVSDSGVTICIGSEVCVVLIGFLWVMDGMNNFCSFFNATSDRWQAAILFPAIFFVDDTFQKID
jgi:hypothetical protein